MRKAGAARLCWGALGGRCTRAARGGDQLRAGEGGRGGCVNKQFRAAPCQPQEVHLGLGDSSPWPLARSGHRVGLQLASDALPSVFSVLSARNPCRSEPCRCEPAEPGKKRREVRKLGRAREREQGRARGREQGRATTGEFEGAECQPHATRLGLPSGPSAVPIGLGARHLRSANEMLLQTQHTHWHQADQPSAVAPCPSGEVAPCPSGVIDVAADPDVEHG